MVQKRGQGLSLNVIIVAALALIVLVVLIMVFTGRIAIFEKGISKEGQAELIKMRIQYGDCHPSATVEANFDLEHSRGDSIESKEQAKVNFRGEVSRCNELTDKVNCGSAGCSWS